MTEQDFYKLHINQEIYYKGEMFTIISLERGMDKQSTISFREKVNVYYFNQIMQDLSFEPPKTKKKKKYFRYFYKYSDIPDGVFDSQFTTESWDEFNLGIKERTLVEIEEREF